MAKKHKRQYLTVEEKTSIVTQFVKDLEKDPSLTIASRAKQVGVHTSPLRKWMRDPRYGGVPGLLVRGKKKVRRGLPVEPRKKIYRAKPLVAIRFVCPHCGGPIIAGGNNA